MRRLIFLAAIFLVTGIALAAGSDDVYLDIYNEILTADSLQQSGQVQAAAAKYADAQKRLEQFKSDAPIWNPNMVAYRLQYLAEKLQALGYVSPSKNVPAAPATPVKAPAAVSRPSSALEQQIAGLQEQVRALTAANGELENKVKEALSVQPAAVSPVEVAKRDEEILALKKEKDLLSVAVDQAKAEKAAANSRSPAASAESAEMERLRARLAVLEAKPAPYTAEELAVLRQGQSQPLAPPAEPASRPHVTHSMMDLPPGAGALMRDALRASDERDFAGAEAKYKEILRQDENNVYVLAFLADAQFAEGHLEDCGKTVDKAIALDPDYPASLYVLGLLRYRQEKLDDALDALSRSAKFNPTNASTQNFLGCVLADKGLRPQAETAFRKALQIEPDYRDAHYNIAFIYATEKPPSPELARWHYNRAVVLGHAKNPSLEAILAGGKQP